MTSTVDPAPIRRFVNALGLDDLGARKLFRLLKQPDLQWSALADVAAASPLAEQVAPLWIDYRMQQGYLAPRVLAQAGSVLALGRELGAVPVFSQQLLPDGYCPALDPRTWGRPPAWKSIRLQLAQQLIKAGAPDPEGLRSPVPNLIISLPPGLDLMPGAGVAARMLGIETREDGDRLLLRCSVWFDNGAAGSTEWHDTPTQDALGALAWGAVALLQQEPEELRVPAVAPPFGQVIRSKAERPEISRVEPPIRTVSVRREQQEEGGHRESPAPHWRRAHAHRYWVGTGEQRRLVVRWIPALWVDPLDDPDLAA